QRFTMVSRTLGWDQRFIYMEQSLWNGRECCNHMLLRVAIVGSGRAGLVKPAEFVAALDHAQDSPPLPEWVQGWIAADALRPWPPALPDIPAADRTGDLPR